MVKKNLNNNSQLEDGYRSPWTEAENYKVVKGNSAGSKFKWITVAVILIVAVGAISLWLFLKDAQKPSVGLEFSRPGQVMLGHPFDIDVTFSNFSDSVLKNARLSFSLPEGVSFAGQPADQRVLEQNVGDVGPGSINKEPFKLIVTSGDQTIKHLEASLNYYVSPNDKVLFEDDTELDIVVGRPAISLEMEVPESVFSSEEFQVKIKYSNDSAEDLDNLSLVVSYPAIFQFKEASEDPTKSNNIWSLGNLAKSSEGEILVTGTLVGQEGSFANFDASIDSEISGESYIVVTQSASLGISQAPLSITITTNNKSDGAAQLGERMDYRLVYKNNSGFPLQNVTIKAKLIGELFDFSSVQADAAFNSLTNTVSWTAATIPELSSLAAGKEGIINLRISLKDSFPIKRISDKNFFLKVEAEISSPTVPPNTQAEESLSLAQLETKMIGKVEVDSQGYYRDAASGFINSGPFPPQVNKPTQYTIHWVVTNHATDLSGVTISAYLQSGAKFTGNIKSNLGGQPIFDQTNNKVTWQIDSLPATKGIVGVPAEAIFQIEVTPAVNQIGRIIDLIGDTQIEGKDEFVGVILTGKDNKITTLLPDDPTVDNTSKGVKP